MRRNGKTILSALYVGAILRRDGLVSQEWLAEYVDKVRQAFGLPPLPSEPKEVEMEGKHTPGPDYFPIKTGEQWREERERRVREAAPELLEACKRALAVLDQEPANAIYKAHRQIVAEAIAKAEGGQQ